MIPEDTSSHNRDVIVADYGMGNIWSVKNAISYLGYTPIVTTDPEIVGKAQKLILPGVGSFRKAMESLRQTGMDQAIRQAVKDQKGRILGICLGMQLLGSHGTEDGETAGLNLVSMHTDRFLPEELGGLKTPHIGFNSVRSVSDSILFKGLPNETDFYFVHSFRMLPDATPSKRAIGTYGVEFLAGFEYENICATQFHPEKSQTNGLVLLKNFLESSDAC